MLGDSDLWEVTVQEQDKAILREYEGTEGHKNSSIGSDQRSV